MMTYCLVDLIICTVSAINIENLVFFMFLEIYFYGAQVFWMVNFRCLKCLWKWLSFPSLGQFPRV